MLALLIIPVALYANCPEWIGRNDVYSVGTIVTFSGHNFQVTRTLDNGWISPDNTWFWTQTGNNCDNNLSSSSSSPVNSDSAVGVLQQILAELQSIKATNNQLLASLSNQSIAPTEITDERDGQTYPLVRIGTTLWMAADLNYALPGSSTIGGAAAYTWEQANNACPAGMHLPTLNQVNELITQAGNGDPLRSQTGWSTPGSDQLGFHALPRKGAAAGSGVTVRYTAYWTTALTSESLNQYKVFSIQNYSNSIDNSYQKSMVRLYDHNENGDPVTVRCVMK